MIKINKDTFESEVLKFDGLVLVEFARSEGCSNCKSMAPTMEEFERLNPNIRVCIYECGKEPDEITSKYQFRMFPGIFSFYKGNPVRGYSGITSLKRLGYAFTVPDELKIRAWDAKAEAEFLENELKTYNKDTQIDTKIVTSETPKVEVPTVNDPAEDVQCDSCQ